MEDVPLIKQFLQYQSQFMAYLMAITRDFDASEEIFQNAAIVVMERSAKSNETIHDFRAWAKEIVRRQALHYLRNQVKSERQLHIVEPSLVEQITRSFMDDRSSAPQRTNELKALQQCIGQAKEFHQKLLQLRYAGRKSFAEIAKIVDKSESAVQRAMSRIRKQLHDCVRSKLRTAEAR